MFLQSPVLTTPEKPYSFMNTRVDSINDLRLACVETMSLHVVCVAVSGSPVMIGEQVDKSEREGKNWLTESVTTNSDPCLQVIVCQGSELLHQRNILINPRLDAEGSRIHRCEGEVEMCVALSGDWNMLASQAKDGIS